MWAKLTVNCHRKIKYNGKSGTARLPKSLLQWKRWFPACKTRHDGNLLPPSIYHTSIRIPCGITFSAPRNLSFLPQKKRITVILNKNVGVLNIDVEALLDTTVLNRNSSAICMNSGSVHRSNVRHKISLHVSTQLTRLS